MSSADSTQAGTGAELTRAQKLWALTAAVIFVLSLCFLGFAVTTRNAVLFAVGWPLLQVLGYSGSLKRARGDTAHYLFKAQVLLNCTVVALIAASLVKAL